jgi:thiol:disulfide interchange protein DsbD
MFRRATFLFIYCAAALLASCGGAGEGNREAAPANVARKAESAAAAPGADAVRASVSEVKLKAGGSGEAVVRLNIAGGFHVNSNAPGDKYVVPTRIEAAPGAGLKAGAAVYPAGVRKQFPFSEEPLSVYEGEVAIRLPLSAEAGAAKGRHTVSADITVQPCDDRECFPPRKINAAVPVVVE